MIGSDDYAALVDKDISRCTPGELKPKACKTPRCGGKIVDVEHLLAALVLVVGEIDITVGRCFPPDNNGKTSVKILRGDAPRHQEAKHNTWQYHLQLHFAYILRLLKQARLCLLRKLGGRIPSPSALGVNVLHAGKPRKESLEIPPPGV